jgi:hypothetical protein
MSIAPVSIRLSDDQRALQSTTLPSEFVLVVSVPTAVLVI